MTVEGSDEFVPCHAATIIRDNDTAFAAIMNVDVYIFCAGINGVFDQFFYRRSGSFQNFAGGDLIDQSFRQVPDTHMAG